MNEPASPAPFDPDAYAPAEFARRVATARFARPHLPLLQTLVLGVLAGGFIRSA